MQPSNQLEDLTKGDEVRLTGLKAVHIYGGLKVMNRECISKTITAGTIALTGGSALLLPAVWIQFTKNRTVIPPGEAPREAIVLGCRPGPGLERRVLGAIRLFEEGKVDRIIFSGSGEARACAAYALSRDVRPHHLVLEEQARNTYENLVYSRSLLQDWKAWVVTDDWHMPRALHLGRGLGLALWPYPVRQENRAIKSHFRESVSWVHQTSRWLLNHPTSID